MLSTIIKRDGKSVPFDASKILNAVAKANKAVGEEEMTPTDLLFVTEKVCQTLKAKKLDHVEEIQDIVEEALIRFGYAKTAKAYILYRAEHTKIREAESYLMDIYKKLTWSAAQEEDIKRENANIDGDTAMGTMLKYGSEGSKYFIDNYVLPKDASAAHAGGDIHIHDKDFYMLTETCCQIDLIPLFKNGFSTGHGYLREPNCIESYSALACIAIQANQNEMHGGQSSPNFDYAMAPGIVKTYKKEYEKLFVSYLQIKENLSSQDAALKFDRLRSQVGGEVRMGQVEQYGRALAEAAKTAFNEKDASRESVELVRQAHAYAAAEAYKSTDRRTYQAMEALIHNLNTMNSRAGAQVPFSSINYGTDTSPEGRLAVMNLLKATQAGLGSGETSIFPVQIFKVKEGVNYNPG
ncbi:MAG: anaerobic ribonucleoside triphosphate reductase, partial [Deltaproteobacteria bacterium]|nr:anaerobic ribonucleoside triphosphate reductase [Deltaproteobacteria bacterium]